MQTERVGCFGIKCKINDGRYLMTLDGGGPRVGASMSCQQPSFNLHPHPLLFTSRPDKLALA